MGDRRGGRRHQEGALSCPSALAPAFRPRGTRNGALAPGPRAAFLRGHGLGRGVGGGASGRASQLQTRLAPRRARFVPPGDRPWAARSAGTHPGDVVTGAFLQTPVGGTPSGLRGATIGLHVVDGKVAIHGGKLKACSVAERHGSQPPLRLVLRGPRAASASGVREAGGKVCGLASSAGGRVGANCFSPQHSSPGSAGVCLLL